MDEAVVQSDIVINRLAQRVAQLEVDVIVRDALIGQLKERIMQIEAADSEDKEKDDATG